MGIVNPNDKTAKYYDIVYRDIKGLDVITSETKLISTLVKRNVKILDLGAGTGRNAMALANAGYKIVAIDSSRGMITELKKHVSNKKLKNIKVLNNDIFKVKNDLGNFDLIILMWNSFNEIVTTKKDALRLLKKLKSLLDKNGKVLINIDDTKVIDVPNFNHSLVVREKNLTYKQTWTVKKFYKAYNTTISEERIQVIQGKMVKQDVKALIKQRWWSLDDIKSLSASTGFKLQNKKIRENEELYLVLS